MITLRTETLADSEFIRALTVSAFGHSDLGHNGEADLIDRIRGTSSRQLSVVACSDGEIRGHILFTPVTIRTPHYESTGMGLAPMSVSPQHQNAGIGSSLVIYGLDQLSKEGCPFVVVLGHSEYYSRFGFRPAAQFGVSHGFAGVPQDVFFIHCTSDDILKQLSGGRAYYQPEFGAQHDGT